MSTQPRAVPVVTPWSAVNGFDPCAAYGITADDAARCDALYRQMVVEIIDCVMPWLPKALRDAGALAVGAGPGIFEIVLPGGERHQVAELANSLKLVPWRMPGESCH